MTKHQEYFPLTHAQLRIWYAEKKYSGTNLGNLLCIHEFDEIVDPGLLQKAIIACIEENEGLRIRLTEKAAEVMQHIHPDVPDHIPCFQFTGDPEKFRKLEAIGAILFPLIDHDLYYFMIYQTGPRYGFLVKLHHIISDAWSVRLLADHIMDIYAQLKSGTYIPQYRPSYMEAVHQEQRYLQSGTLAKHRAYWLSYLETIRALRLGKPAAGDVQIDSRRISFYLNPDQTSSLRTFCISQNIQPFHFLFSLFIGCLSRISRQTEFTAGTVMHNRSGQREKWTLGMFVNTIPIRVKLDYALPFSELVHSIASEMKQHFRHQKYPFDLLLQDVQAGGGARDWLQTVFSYDTFTHCLCNQWLPGGKEIVPLVLHATERESKARLKFEFDYQTARFDEEDIRRIYHFMHRAMLELMDNPGLRMDELQMIDDDERNLLMFRFNPDQTPPEKFVPLHEMVVKQACRYPDHPAVVDEDGSLSYHELNVQSDRLAALLTDQGIASGSRVGCCINRSRELAVVLLGILKTGAAYIPVDPEYPGSRIQYIIEDSAMNLIITRREYQELIPSGIPVIDISNCKLLSGNKHAPEICCSPDDLLYIIYTSGSTGTPKGVMIEQAGFYNLMCVNQDLFEHTSHDRMTQVTSPGFDGMAFELWTCLTGGSTLCIIEDPVRKDPTILKKWLIDQKITISYQPTAIAEFLLNEQWPEPCSLRTLYTAGDRLKQYPRSGLPFKVLNLYGPTEDTVTTSVAEIKAGAGDGYPPIGKPIRNHRIYILNEAMQIQPVGVTGEICIAGTGLARGYVNQPELTEKKFVNGPEWIGRYYRTGDLGYWDWKGILHFAGRMDSQVQIHGFRIELGEIEHQIRQIPGVDNAIVIAHNLNGQNQLRAFVTGHDSLNPEGIRDCLRGSVPAYMVPAFIQILDVLPLNAHGKPDVSALPDRDASQESRSKIAPRDDVERLLAGAFEKYLSLSSVSITDHFFEMGGDSIKAIQIAYEIQKHGYQMKVADLYEAPSIEQLGRLLKKIDTLATLHVNPDHIALAPVQHWFFEQSFTGQHIWNQALMLRTRRRLQPETVQLVMLKMMDHHEALNFRYRVENGHWNVSNPQDIQSGFEYVFTDLRTSDACMYPMHVHIHDMQQRMNLEEGALVKLGHFRTIDGDFIGFIIHHLAVDGLSWRILIEDFITGYGAELTGRDWKLPDVPVCYAQWTAQLTVYAESVRLLQELEYWQRIEYFNSDSLKTSNRLTARLTKQQHVKKLVISAEDTKALLSDVHTAFQTNVQDILLSGLTLSLNHWQGLQQVLIDLESHGRIQLFPDVPVSRTAGWFTSIYPVGFSVKPGGSLAYHIKSTKETLRRVPGQGAGYGILRYLTPPDKKKGIRLNAGGEICFNYLGEIDAVLKNNPLDLTMDSFTLITSPESEKPYAIEINALVRNGRLEIWFGYNELEFDESAIQDLVEKMEQQIRAIIAFCPAHKKTEFTPSDYGDNSLSLTDLDTITHMMNCIE